MSDVQRETAALQERIARSLWAHDPPFVGFSWDDAEDNDEDKAYYLGLAASVLADLGFEQVGWFSESDLHYTDRQRKEYDLVPVTPAYRLRAVPYVEWAEARHLGRHIEAES